MAGDRWQLSLEARITIPVREANLPPELAPQATAVAAALGPQLVFSQKDARNFIAATKAPALLKEMETRALDLAAHYFGHADFARRLIRLRYAQHLERLRWHGFGDGGASAGRRN